MSSWLQNKRIVKKTFIRNSGTHQWEVLYRNFIINSSHFYSSRNYSTILSSLLPSSSRWPHNPRCSISLKMLLGMWGRVVLLVLSPLPCQDGRSRAGESALSLSLARLRWGFSSIHLIKHLDKQTCWLQIGFILIGDSLIVLFWIRV